MYCIDAVSVGILEALWYMFCQWIISLCILYPLTIHAPLYIYPLNIRDLSHNRYVLRSLNHPSQQTYAKDSCTLVCESIRCVSGLPQV